MVNKITPLELLGKLEFLFEKYSDELRATTQPYMLRRAEARVSGYEYHPEDAIVRESLMEHVGSLPMVATAFYPYINDPEVDLGQALVMLAIHDIGELITGDEMSYVKSAAKKHPERDAALKLLHPYYHTLYDDVETQTSKSAKFAKSIDMIVPDIHEYLAPAHITLWRYKHFAKKEPHEIISTIEKHERPYMSWNPFMAEFHKLLLDKIEAKLKAETI